MKATYARREMHMLFSFLDIIRDRIQEAIDVAFVDVQKEQEAYDNKPWIYRFIFSGPSGRYPCLSSEIRQTWQYMTIELADITKIINRLEFATKTEAAFVSLTDSEVTLLEVYNRLENDK